MAIWISDWDFDGAQGSSLADLWYQGIPETGLSTPADPGENEDVGETSVGRQIEMPAHGGDDDADTDGPGDGDRSGDAGPVIASGVFDPLMADAFLANAWTPAAASAFFAGIILRTEADAEGWRGPDQYDPHLDPSDPEPVQFDPAPLTAPTDSPPELTETSPLHGDLWAANAAMSTGLGEADSGEPDLDFGLSDPAMSRMGHCLTTFADLVII